MWLASVNTGDVVERMLRDNLGFDQINVNYGICLEITEHL
jgi:PIN domain nuclease of toxin-antitoxin system